MAYKGEEKVVLDATAKSVVVTMENSDYQAVNK